MKKIKSIFTIAIGVALASQIKINFFVPGFIVALSVAILPVFLYFYKQFNPIEILFVTGIIYPLYRGIFLYFDTNNLHTTIGFIGANVLFYFSYGILFYLLYWKKKKKGITAMSLS